MTKHKYYVGIEKQAKKKVDRLPGHVRQRAKRMIMALRNDPQPPRSQELRGQPNIYRIPLDKWRLIYRLEEDIKTVTILAVRFKTGPETYEDIE